jgi:hypothetical protein
MDRTESAGVSSESQDAVPAPLALMLQADADIHSLVTSCCMQTLWQLPSALQEVTKPLQPTKEGSASDAIGRAPSGALPEAADEEAAAAEVPAAAAEGPNGMPRQPSGRPGQLSLPDAQGVGSDASAAPSVAPSPHNAAEEQARRERSESGGLASGSSPSASSAAAAARAAWAASAGGGGAAADRAKRRPARASSTGEPKRTLGLTLSPRTSMGSTITDRLLGRRSLVGGTLADEEDDDDVAGGRAVAFLLEWEACVRVDADSRLQLLAADSAVLVACGFDDLGISGKSVTALRLGGCDRGRRPSREAPGMQRRSSGALHDEEEPQETGRPGLFTAEFSVQVSLLSSTILRHFTCFLHQMVWRNTL